MNDDAEAELADLLQFLYVCPAGLVEVAPNGSIGMMNPLALQLLMPLAANLQMTNFFTIMDPYAPELKNLVEAFHDREGSVCENHRVYVGENRNTREPKVLSCTLVKLSETRLMATLFDVSKQVSQERRLKQAETWFASLLDGINDFAVVSLDAEGRIDGLNPSVIRQTGFNDDEIIGRTLDMFATPDAHDRFPSANEQIDVARRDGWHLDEGWRQRRSGDRYWCQSLIAVRGESDGEERTVSGYTVVLRDVTQQQHDTSALRRMLTTDYLTGASNRSHFFEMADKERARSARTNQSLSIVTIDVDHFKKVNDHYGHGVGDAVLKAISAACLHLVRPNDIFARLGGEEFAILAPSVGMEGAMALAERLRASIAALSVDTPLGPLQVTASFGCATLGEDITTILDLLGQGDKALYAAKEAGRNCVMCYAKAQAAA